jgi:serine/threonine protein kinase
VKILDLGLARLRQRTGGEDATSITGSNTTMMGTVDYMAPEQAIDSHAVDIRADIYSLGCTLFYLLTGQPPFPGGTEAEKLVKHQMKLPPDVREMRPEVPEHLAAILGKMLAKEPAQRFQTPGELLRALTGDAGAFNAAKGDATVVVTTAPGRPEFEGQRLPVRGRFRVVWLLLSGVSLTVLAVLIASLSLPQGPGKKSLAVTTPRPTPADQNLLFAEDFAGGKFRPEWRLPNVNHWKTRYDPESKGYVLTGGTFTPVDQPELRE